MKTKSSLNFFDIDAFTSVLEIARTASYAVEMNRLVKLAMLSSSRQERACEYYKHMLVTAYRGGAVDDSPEGDLQSLVADWAAVGADMHAVCAKVNLEPAMVECGLANKWKNVAKPRMRDVHGLEKSALR